MNTTTDNELLDICDRDDRVIGTATRAEIHQRGLLHRAVHIWVFRPDGCLLIHRRSPQKYEHPLARTSSASGHVDAGESYEAAASRELQEELGLAAPLTWLIKLPASAETALEHTMLYRCATTEQPIPDPEEIESIEWVNVDELARRVEREPGSFTPPFRALIRWYTSEQRRPPLSPTP